MVLQYRAEIELGSVGLRIDLSGQARKPESQKANGANRLAGPLICITIGIIWVGF